MDYLSRYDATRPRDQTPASVGQQRRCTSNEWFRKPPPTGTSQQTPSSQSSFIVEDNSDNEVGPTRAEGESYLSIPTVSRAQYPTALSWWQANEANYPYLAQVARDILSVQIAQVGVERTFNLA